jgi:hypothetical protein
MRHAFNRYHHIYNAQRHEFALRFYTVVVLAHWAEHLVQAFQIYILNMARPDSRGVLGQFFPWLVTSEWLHYAYAIFMLVGFFFLRKGFVGRSKTWWTIALVIQFWHHIEHLLLLLQAAFNHNLFNSPVPVSILQLYIPRVELHMFYNTIVTIPMALSMYYHLFPTRDELGHMECTCAVK